MAARSRLAALFALLAIPTSTAAQVMDTEQVAMRDGVTLATDVWRSSADAAPGPTLLRRTPYGRAMDTSALAPLVALGYTVVSQDVRGRGESDGTFLPFLDDAHDGADTIAWIASQPWSDGTVGSFGGSAEGIAQLLAAGEAPSALACLHAPFATDDVYAALYPGGAWREELGTAWLEGLMEPDALTTLRAHEAGDAFWDPARLDAMEQADVGSAVFLVGGFFDVFAAGTTRAFGQLDASAARYLVLGPWTHAGADVTTAGELTYPADAAYSALMDDLAAYFGWCLGDGPRPDWPPVRYYATQIADDGRTAGGAWREASDWPPPSAPVELRLHADGTLHASAPGTDAASATLPVDPSDPVPSVGGDNLTTPAGPFDQSEVDGTSGVLTATTPVATETVELIGDVSARIYASTDGTDTDVVVRLEQITPSGRALLLAEGIRRGRFLAAADTITPLEPGAVALFEVDLGPIAVVLPPGHALRVAIAGTSSPRYEPDPGVADPIASAVPQPTRLTIYRDASRPSAVVLPIARGTPPGAADGTSLADAGVGVPSPSGCGCRVVARDPGVPLWPMALVLLARRRRRRFGRADVAMSRTPSTSGSQRR